MEDISQQANLVKAQAGLTNAEGNLTEVRAEATPEEIARAAII